MVEDNGVDRVRRRTTVARGIGQDKQRRVELIKGIIKRRAIDTSKQVSVLF